MKVSLKTRPACAEYTEEALGQAERDKNDLDAVVAMYGIAGYFEHCGKSSEAEDVMRRLLRRKSVWPCISYLAAWNDRKMNTNKTLY